MTIDLKIYGNINIKQESNVFLFSKDEASFYDELYAFKKWPNLELDLVSNKLINSATFDFNKACDWMQGWYCDNTVPQYVWVRNSSGIYTIYFNTFESIQYFRKFVLGEDIKRLVLYYGYRLNSKDDVKIVEENKKSRDIYQAMFEFFEDKIKTDFSFSKLPYIHTSGWDKRSGHKNILIIDSIPQYEYKIKEFEKECGEYQEHYTDSYHNALDVLIDYGNLGKCYLEPERK